MKERDLVVVGGGIGGYTCAIRASQLGLKTMLVEKSRLGGECLIAGCIPSKSIISASRIYDRAREGARFGIHADGLRVDLGELQAWKSGVVATLESGVARLCQGSGVEIVKGDAELMENSRIVITGQDNADEVSARSIVIATGSTTISLPSMGFDGRLVITSREALELQSLPRRMIVVGGGYIGMEIASMYQRLGSQITIVELTDQLLPGTEPDLVRYVQRNLEKRGATIHLKSRVLELTKGQGWVKVEIQTESGRLELEGDVLLVSVGRRPATEKLNLGKLGIETDPKGFVKTNDRMMTSRRGIYAIGDVRGPPLLAHKAQREGIVAAESIAGLPTAADWKTIPWTIFTDPEISGAGLTEKQALDAGYAVKKSRVSFAALGRALAAGEPEGFVRIISEQESGVVLGVQIVGPEASDLISEATLAIEMGATVDDLALTIHPHPTLPEAIMEAAESATGRSVHQLRL